MKNKLNKYSVLFLTVFCLMYTLLFADTVYASVTETTTETATSNIQHIYDDANLLSTAEAQDLEEMCIKYSEEAGIDIIILSHDDANAPDEVTYIEDFYDKMQYGDSVILLVDMYNRKVCIEGYGLAETYIHSKRGDIIRNDITPYLTDKDYVTAFQIFITSSAAYMKDDSELNYDHNYTYDSAQSGNSSVKSTLSNGFYQLIASLIIGGIAVGIMVYNSGGKMTAGGNTYLEGGNSGLIGRRDNYIRTTVTRVRKPTQNNNGRGGFNAGGFGGGMSGGGSSHSTSSGGF